MKNDDVSNQIGIRLLPEGFLPPAPDGRDDGGDVEGLGVRIKIIVQGIVTDVRFEADIDVVRLSTALCQDARQVPAKIAFDLQNDAGKFLFPIARPVSEQLVHRRENQAPSFAPTVRDRKSTRLNSSHITIS